MATESATNALLDGERPDRPTLLHRIVELLTQTGAGQPTAVGIAFPGDEIELALKPLEHCDVVQGLAGFRAPNAWEAFAVVAPATARHLDGGPTQRVVLGVLAARDGFVASSITGLDREPPSEPGEGRVVDACRRVLGLPTDPPVATPAAWAATHWVDAILAAVVGSDLGRIPSWPELQALDTASRDAHRSWSALRQRCAAGKVHIPSIDRHAAQWMDDGMFSREALGAYPPIPSLIADLRQLLPWATYESLLRALCDRLERHAPPGQGEGSLSGPISPPGTSP